MKHEIPLFMNTAKPIFEKDKPWLAPMAGYSDLPFRLLCKELGAYVCETEMISAKGLVYSSCGTEKLLENSQEEAPLVVQLFGSEPAAAKTAAYLLRQKGWLWFDFNLGCPANKVLRQGSGAALLDDPDKVLEIAKSILSAINNPPPGSLNEHIKAMAGFKLRLGRTGKKKVLPDLALRLQDIGCSWICLHPRYGEEGYTGNARWEELQKLNEMLDIPLIASGDLLTAQKGIECLAQTGVQTIMYARGALRDPAIFQKHASILNGEYLEKENVRELKKIIKRHIFLTRDIQGSKKAIFKMRSIIPRYVRNFPGVGNLRQALCSCTEWNEVENLLDQFIKDIEEKNL